MGALQEFLASEREREAREREEDERQQREKDRILRRIMDANLRMAGVGFRQALQYTIADREAEIAFMRRIVDANTRLMSAGYNKLIEEWKARQNNLKEKLKFVLKALTDKDSSYMLMAYNGMKQRMMMLNGVGMGDSELKKIQLIKRLTNQGYNLQVMGANALQEFLTSEREREAREKEEYERQQREKDRILRRIMDANLRMAGVGFRQALQYTIADREAEIALMRRQRGIMRRIVDANTRLMSAGYNKLVEESKMRKQMLQDKLRFVIRSLTDKDVANTL